VPTQMKPEQTLGERLSELEQQRRQAADAITLAEQRTEEIATRQQQIAVTVVSEDEEAVTENEQLEEALLLERRRAVTARSAAEQLGEQIDQAKEELAEEERRGHLRQAAQLARERYEIEAQAEQEMRLLLKTLSELGHLDRRHCQELRAGGLQAPTDPLGWMVEAWLLTRLAGWVSENPRHQGFAAKDLPEFDGLASKATPEGA
jgi:hypothetical protein